MREYQDDEKSFPISVLRVVYPNDIYELTLNINIIFHQEVDVIDAVIIQKLHSGLVVQYNIAFLMKRRCLNMNMSYTKKKVIRYVGYSMKLFVFSTQQKVFVLVPRIWFDTRRPIWKLHENLVATDCYTVQAWWLQDCQWVIRYAHDMAGNTVKH